MKRTATYDPTLFVPGEFARMRKGGREVRVLTVFGDEVTCCWADRGGARMTVKAAELEKLG